MTGRFPAASQYVAAVQYPATCFPGAELKNSQVASGLLGLPASASGQNAIVFRMITEDREVAIRCFTSPATEGRARYEALAAHLEENPCPLLASARWVDQGIRIGSECWPVVEMEWVQGQLLHTAVANDLQDPQRLNDLAERWREATRTLNDAGIAHGDLQHGNILVESSGALRLVDFDGTWVPAIATHPPREVGHPNFQHPTRIEAGTWGPRIDTFAALVIYLSLRALAADPTLWDLHNGENLIFTAADFRAVGQTPAWQRLRHSPEAQIVVLAELLQDMCHGPAQPETSLEDLLTAATVLEAIRRPGAKRDTTVERPPVVYSEATDQRSPSATPERDYGFALGDLARQMLSADERTHFASALSVLEQDRETVGQTVALMPGRTTTRRRVLLVATTKGIFTLARTGRVVDEAWGSISSAMDIGGGYLAVTLMDGSRLHFNARENSGRAQPFCEAVWTAISESSRTDGQSESENRWYGPG